MARGTASQGVAVVLDSIGAGSAMGEHGQTVRMAHMACNHATSKVIRLWCFPASPIPKGI